MPGIFDTGIFDTGIFDHVAVNVCIFDTGIFDTGIFDHCPDAQSTSAGSYRSSYNQYRPPDPPKRKKRKRKPEDPPLPMDLGLPDFDFGDELAKALTRDERRARARHVAAEKKRLAAAYAEWQRIRRIIAADDEWLMLS